jgi:lipopolysaccharide/colanic/teichoic acid biosynthesis glycosyltransferase
VSGHVTVRPRWPRLASRRSTPELELSVSQGPVIAVLPHQGGGTLVRDDLVVTLAPPRARRLAPATGTHLFRLAAKEILDRFAAFALLVGLLPLLLLVGIGVRLGSPGPAIFRQERIGRNGREFHIWKFRSMRDGADIELQALLAENGRDGEPLFKVPNDPRITRLGAFLRRTSLDELPQLVNVLLGHMSLVGPRPQRAVEVALYAPEDWARLGMKPGITGLWQVSGRSTLSWSQAIDCDLRYVREWSLLFDLRILARTVVVVLRREGAV